MAVGPEEIVDAYNHAEEHMEAHSNLFLMTSHTSKGKFKILFMTKHTN